MLEILGIVFFLFATIIVMSLYANMKLNHTIENIWRETYSHLKNMESLGIYPLDSHNKATKIGYVYGYFYRKVKTPSFSNEKIHKLTLEFTEEFFHIPLHMKIKGYIDTNNEDFFKAWTNGRLDAE